MPFLRARTRFFSLLPGYVSRNLPAPIFRSAFISPENFIKKEIPLRRSLYFF